MVANWLNDVCNINESYCLTAMFAYSLLGLLPCSAYEIYLCALAVRAQATPLQFAIIAMLLVFLSPLVFAAYVFLILYHIVLVRSTLIITDTGMELLYDRRVPSPAERDVKKNDAVDKGYKLTLQVKCLRGEITQGRFLFQKSNLRAVLKLGDEDFETRSVETMDMKPQWFGNHDFVFNPERNLKIKISILDSEADGNDRVLGTCSESVERWIANGRFEGDVTMKKYGQPVGKVSLAVKLLRETKSSSADALRKDSAGPPASRRPSIEPQREPATQVRTYYVHALLLNLLCSSSYTRQRTEASSMRRSRKEASLGGSPII